MAVRPRRDSCPPSVAVTVTLGPRSEPTPRTLWAKRHADCTVRFSVTPDGYAPIGDGWQKVMSFAGTYDWQTSNLPSLHSLEDVEKPLDTALYPR